MKVVTIPNLSDNYAYLIICEDSKEAAVVDPAEFKPIDQTIRQYGVRLTAILNTHHHWDHVGANLELLGSYRHLRVYGHQSDKKRIPGQTDFLSHGDSLHIGNLTATITHNPGHTSGAISYFVEDCCFTGDTLFAAGCGRLFEGTAADMYRSLNEVIGKHSSETKVYFGHEYTEKNLRFAASVEPDNDYIHEKLELVREMRKQGEFSTPSTLASERATNPFMRCHSPLIQQTVKDKDPSNDLAPASVLKVLRKLKDSF